MKFSVSAVILAGGKAQRMAGNDKGLQCLQGVPLYQHSLMRLRPQVADIAINANRNLATYAASGLPVFNDELADFQGPLSGMLTALKRAHTDFVLFVPCDCPYFPLDLLNHLQSAVENHHGLGAYATDNEREHPTFCLLSRQVIPALENYLQRGERRIRFFMQSINAIPVTFDNKTAFANINTLEDLLSQRAR